MNFEAKINEELKTAIRAGDKIRLETIRGLRARIIEFNKSGSQRDLNEDDAIKILNFEAKKRKDAIEMYEKGGRADLADREKAELKVIQEFLPQQLTIEEITAMAEELIIKFDVRDSKDFGRIMGALMPKVTGKADGKVVTEIIKNLLSNS
ncbi:MAG: GatB/YqeY domain-containing protein [Candidatus Kapabacteria bacterium]|nr:GatB/YqeY domain-containing protein [Candidatus Kapabacteria bacterium]